ncbi:MAG: FMN-binding negative transcriptional regulator [Cypionkella sp.]
MHPNPAFRSTPLEDNLAFARARGFGVLSVNGADGPLAAHVPFLLSPDASFAELHLARSNPVGRACLAGPIPALIAISGPDAYISPDWYGVEDQVPTWNYIAVHLRGMLSPLPEAALQPHADALSAEHESRLSPKVPWQSGKMSEGALPRMLWMILPFRFEVASVDGTWKLNQNKTPEVRASAASHLAQQADIGSQAIAALMRRNSE